ncbi:MAG: molybdenum cofactor biosynthesis protein MoaE [Deinococcales bacterium]
MSASRPSDLDLLVVHSSPIDAAALLSDVGEPAWGARASFLGSVRSPNRGAVVHYIDYEGYEAMMVAEMRRLADEVRSRHDIGRVAIVHRLGRLVPGEVSLAVVVASPHRHAALRACEELVEGLKARLPVWKYEVDDAGGAFVGGRTEAGPTL